MNNRTPPPIRFHSRPAWGETVPFFGAIVLIVVLAISFFGG